MDYKLLAEKSRVWIYQSNRRLTEQEVKEIKGAGNQFIQSWATHGKDLEAAFEVFENLFLVLFVDEAKVSASGCSIDSSVHFIKEIESRYNIDCFDRMNIAYEIEGTICFKKMSEFQDSIDSGEINENTIVFNNLVESKKDFMENWKVPLVKSWHKQLL